MFSAGSERAGWSRPSKAGELGVNAVVPAGKTLALDHGDDDDEAAGDTSMVAEHVVARVEWDRGMG